MDGRTDMAAAAPISRRGSSGRTVVHGASGNDRRESGGSRPLRPPGVREAIVRGLRRRCPACGEGPMFSRWMRVARRCETCGAAIAPRPGDTWGFWVLLDRVFVFVPIVLIYVGFNPTDPAIRFGVIAAIVVPLVLTMPHRMGICVGLDFVTRATESMAGPATYERPGEERAGPRAQGGGE